MTYLFSTIDGSKGPKELHPGLLLKSAEGANELTSFEEKTGEFEWVIVNDDHIFMADQSLMIDGHAVHAKLLSIGDEIQLESGELEAVTSIDKHTGQGTYYRLEVGGDHTYFQNGTLMHNASRYWVGGSDDWDSTAGSKWSTTSGGSGGSSVPTSSDNVFFDANSGSGTISCGTFDVTNCADLDSTGFTGTFSLANFSTKVYGSLTIGSGVTMTSSKNIFLLNATSGTVNITSNGKSLYRITTTTSASTATYKLIDNLTLTSYFGVGGGTFDANGKTLTCTEFYDASNSNITLNLASATINASTSVLFDTSGTLTVNASGSTVNFTGTTPSFNGGNGKTWGNLNFSGASGTMSITNNCTVNDLTHTNQPVTIRITSGKTVTVNGTFNLSGTSGNLVTLDTTSAGSAATLSKSSGVVSCDYMSIKDSTATGGAGWYAGTHSTNVSGNTGWSFTDGSTTTSTSTTTTTSTTTSTSTTTTDTTTSTSTTTTTTSTSSTTSTTTSTTTTSTSSSSSTSTSTSTTTTVTTTSTSTTTTSTSSSTTSSTSTTVTTPFLSMEAAGAVVKN